MHIKLKRKENLHIGSLAPMELNKLKKEENRTGYSNSSLTKKGHSSLR